MKKLSEEAKKEMAQGEPMTSRDPERSRHVHNTVYSFIRFISQNTSYK